MAEEKPTFIAPGDHPADAFIFDVMKKKFPEIEKVSMEFMENQRVAGDENFSTNPMAAAVYALNKQVKPDMPFEEFMSKFRAKAMKAMEKRKVKPYTVSVGPVGRPLPETIGQTSLEILKSLVSPFWDGTVGVMRMAAAPLADLPENQDANTQELIRRGLLPPMSELERKKGQVEVLTGLLGVGAGGQISKAVGAAKAGSAHLGGLAGYLKGVIEGGAWMGAFSAAHATGQEQAAEDILEEAKAGAVAGAALGAGLGIAGRAVGAGIKKYRSWKLEKLLQEVDNERLALGAHAQEMEIPDPLKELLPDGGLRPSVAQVSAAVRETVANVRPYKGPFGYLPSSTPVFENIDIPDLARHSLSPEQVAFLKRADQIMGEKNIRFNYETGELTAIPTEGPGMPSRPLTGRSTAPDLTGIQQARAMERGLDVPASGELTAVAPPAVQGPSGRQMIPPVGAAGDTPTEVAYRLMYGDRVFYERAAEYDLLPPEAKARIDFWTYIDKTEGTGAANFLRKMENSAKARLQKRGAGLKSTVFDITQAGKVGLTDLTDASIIGAAKLFRLAHLAPETAVKLWNNEMLQVLGDTPSARSALHRVYMASRKQLEKMVLRMAPEMRDVRALMEKYQQGKAGMDWYTNAFRELEQMYGPEDARLMAHLLAIYSQGTNVDANVTLALKAFADLKANRVPSPGRAGRVSLAMIDKMLAGQPYGDQKIQNFAHLLLGGTGHSVNELQVSRALGWTREAFSRNQYRFVDRLIQDLAKDAGVTAEQYQASLWTTPKIAKAQEAFATGNKRALAHVSSFRPYPEAIRYKNVSKGIHNTLVTPADEGGGGYTFNLNNFDKWEGKGYLATLTSEVVPEQDLTPAKVLKFAHKVRDLVAKYRGRVDLTLGLWNQRNGTVSIDFNLVTPDKEQALQIARNADQFAVGDMTTGSYEGDVPTDKPEGSKQKLLTIAQVRKMLKEIIGAKP